MYGILLESVQHFVQRQYGEDVWTAISREAGAKCSVFSTHQHYPDSLILRLAIALARCGGLSPCSSTPNSPSYSATTSDAAKEQATASVREQPVSFTTPDAVMEFFGRCFVKYMSTFGHDAIIKATGRYFCTFLQSMDNLHQGMKFSFPRMLSPSMQLTRAHSRGAELVYRSTRHGFAHYLMGILYEIAEDTFSLKLSASILKESMEGAYSVVVFRLDFDNFDYVQSLLRKKFMPCVLPPVPVKLLLQLFPFGVLFDRRMKVINAGEKLLRAWGGPAASLLKASASDIFRLRKPKVAFTWEKVVQMQSVLFELELLRVGPVVIDSNRPFVQSARRESVIVGLEGRRGSLSVGLEGRRGSQVMRRGSQGAKCVLLKGQMRHIEEIDAVVFLCSPIFNDLEELTNAGLYLADMNGHGLSREMLVTGWQHCSRLELLFERAENRCCQLEKSHKLLDHWKKRGDRLLYSMIPKPIAEHLRAGKDPMAACQAFDSVTVLFCALEGLEEDDSGTSGLGYSRTQVLGRVAIINGIYSKLDRLLDMHRVYKVETVGDVYMCVSGAPARAREHAQHAAAAALGVARVARELGARARLGVHSGPCMGGVLGRRLPRYCLVGDTVNTASRMQSSSEPGRIQISSATAALLPPGKFRLRSRGLIKVKGKGMMETFWLEGEIDDEQNDDALNMISRLETLEYGDTHVDHQTETHDPTICDTTESDQRLDQYKIDQKMYEQNNSQLVKYDHGKRDAAENNDREKLDEELSNSVMSGQENQDHAIKHHEDKRVQKDQEKSEQIYRNTPKKS